MKRILLLLTLLLLIGPMQAQDYQAGSVSKAYRVFGTDTIYPGKTLYENIKNTQQFTVVAKIFELTSIQDEIDKLGMVTVFLPTDEAFSQYDEKALEDLLSASNAAKLKEALMNHIIMGRVDQNSLQRNLKQNAGSAFFRSPSEMDPEFQQQGSNLMIAIPNAPKAKITEVNYFHKNGYLHMVNAFLMPNE